MKSQPDILAENKKIRKARLMVDLTFSMLAQSELTQVEMINLIRATRFTVLQLFPGKDSTFDLIYKPRLERIMNERLKSN